jgi:hypothetical protein
MFRTVRQCSLPGISWATLAVRCCVLTPRSLLSQARRRLLPALLVGTGIVLASASCSSSTHNSSIPTTTPAATTVPASPASLLASATANAKAQDWVHAVATSHHGSETAVITQNSGPDEGEQSVQIGAAVAKVIVINGDAYIQGNSDAITGYFDFPAADAPTLAGRWISIPPSDSAYATVAAGVSLESSLAEVGLTGNLTETPPPPGKARSSLVSPAPALPPTQVAALAPST